VAGLVPADLHLFGVDRPGRVFLLGADETGRDEWTRVLFGAQVSLTVGLVGIVISFTLGSCSAVRAAISAAGPTP